MNILHISAHYGSGVGSVLKAWKNNDKTNFHRFTHLNDVPNQENPSELFEYDMVSQSDLVVVHFWNHPSMFEFLTNFYLPPCKLIIWSHVSGLFAPYIYCKKLFEYCDKFIFTTPISFNAEEVMSLPDDLKSKIDVVWSTYGLEKCKDVHKEEHTGFNVGIIGTVDYGKLRSDFIEMCSKVNIPDVKFIVCSVDSQDHLINKARAIGTSNKFSFEGRVPSVVDYLKKYDVFGYPLQPKHFGSCEQALGEAMVCGAVPVVFDNAAEKSIVTHMETGMVVSTPDEYVKAIEYLYNNKSELKRMSENAIIAAKKLYSTDVTIQKWNKIFDEVITYKPRERYWSDEKIEPHFVYALSLGKYGRYFYDYVHADLIGDNDSKMKYVEEIKTLYKTNSMFSSTRKGSIRQYTLYYPNNKYLMEWEKLT